MEGCRMILELVNTCSFLGRDAASRYTPIIGLYGNALGALYALPGGSLTDRLGHRGSLMRSR